MKLKAYEFSGGGACPTQYYWHNEDKTEYYYFRYRFGSWTLQKGPADIDTCGLDKYILVASDNSGGEYDGFMLREEFLEVLRKYNIDLEIVTETDELNEI